ncbi:hypothetical protein NP118_23305, partial [Salmonella enterica]|nr:hypothetical protein [Salmonella enterica]
MMKEFMARTDAAIQSNQASMRALELQVGHLANELKARPQGKLPSDTEHPRREGKEQVKAVTLRSGKPLEERIEPSKTQAIDKNGDKNNNVVVEKELESGQGAGGSNKNAGASGSVPDVEPPYVPPPPYV